MGSCLLQVVERTGARRVLIDSMMDLRMASLDETRFVEFMYSLAQRFSRQGISLLTTCEMPGPLNAHDLSGIVVSRLSDNLIMLDHYQERGSMKRSLTIVKTRASGYDDAMSQFSIGPDGIRLGDIATAGDETASDHHRSEALTDSHRAAQ